MKSWLKRKDNTQSIKRAKELRKQGLSYEKIGQRLGFHSSTIMRWLDPAYAQRWREYLRKYQNKKYHTNPEFKKKLIKATVDYIWERMLVCPLYVEQRKKWQQNFLKKHPDYYKK